MIDIDTNSHCQRNLVCVDSQYAFKRQWPRRLDLLLVIVSLLAALQLLPATPVFASPGRLTVLFTNDLHSHLSPHHEIAGQGSVREAGGLARLAFAIGQERKRAGENVLLLDAGDFAEGTLYHTVFSEEALELRLMGALGYDAATFGNHDFDFYPTGTARMLRAARSKTSSLPRLVITNLRFSDGDHGDDELKNAFGEYPVRNSTVIERNGLRIGIFGLLGKDAAEDSPFAKPVTFTDPLEAAKASVKFLREQEKADLVICLSHSGTSTQKRYSEDEHLAAGVPGIDLIVSGHTHSILQSPILSGKTVIVSAGCYGTWLGVLDLNIDKNRNVSVAGYRLRKMDESLPEDETIAKTVAGFTKIIEQRYLTHFGYRFDQALASQPFDGQTIEYSYEHPGETGLGNLVTDAYRYAVEQAEGNRRHIDAAVDVLGCIRESLYKGDVRVSDVFQTAALGPVQNGYCGNTIVVVYLTGHDLKNLLEVETSIAPSKKDALLSVSGIRFRYNPHRMIFDRVTSMEIEGADNRFRPIEKEKLYSVAINSYLAHLIDLIDKKSFGILKITPRDKNANPVEGKDKESLTVTRNGEPLREWVVLAEYLASFPENNGKPTVPERYAGPEGRIVAQPSWNPIDLIAGGNWLTLTAATLIMVAMILVLLVMRRVVAKRDRRSREKR